MQITTLLLTNNFSTLKISKGKKFDVGMSIGIDVDKDIDAHRLEAKAILATLLWACVEWK
jgi:hypothetical protein